MIIHEETGNLITVLDSLDEAFEAIRFPLTGVQIKELDPTVRRITISYDNTVLEELATIRKLLNALPVKIVLVHNHLPECLEMKEYCLFPFMHDERKCRYDGLDGICWWCEHKALLTT